ncbi:MAG: hypothetical protein N3A61_09900, partial [Ignavibacteria bacterium]|nr:hypothetical protein [Ignavibacteria bacterium]
MLQNDDVEVRVKVEDTQGLNDLSSVILNLKEVGLKDSFNLYDDGLHFDLKANDGIFGNKFKVPIDAISGEYKLLLTAEDKAGNKALKNIWFGVMKKDTTSIPPGIPKFFSIGTATTTSEFSWMINNGNECWDAGYQYLTWGWWNWYSGGFVKRFCDNAERSGYIPVLSLYLFQSGAQSFGCSGSEYEKIFCAINNSSLMNEFWNRFIQMCKEAKSSYAKKIIFHIEPDMLGYLQQRAIKENKNPSTISAYVGDSKYQNNLEGMHQRMVDLVREHCSDRGYIAWHASLWGNIISLKDNTEKFLNVDSLAKSTTDFLMRCSPSCDLIFADWSDRDAGYDDIWWDKKNLSVPNFTRAILFNNLISYYSKKKVVLWQIPIGNESLPNRP